MDPGLRLTPREEARPREEAWVGGAGSRVRGQPRGNGA